MSNNNKKLKEIRGIKGGYCLCQKSKESQYKNLYRHPVERKRESNKKPLDSLQKWCEDAVNQCFMSEF